MTVSPTASQLGSPPPSNSCGGLSSRLNDSTEPSECSPSPACSPCNSQTSTMLTSAMLRMSQPTQILACGRPWRGEAPALLTRGT